MLTRKHTQSLYNNMFVLVFLLLARTGCDWVEISQNYYRKEPPRQVTGDIHHEETTEAIIVYRNSSLLDKHWKKGVIDRVSSIVNIRRVHVPSVKTPTMQTENNIFTRQASTHTNAPDGRYDSVNILGEYHEEEKPIEPRERLDVPHHIKRGSAIVRNSEVVSFHKAHIGNTNIVSRIESVNKGYNKNVKEENWNQDIGPIKSTYLRGSENKGIITTEWTPPLKYEDESKVDINYKGLAEVIKDQKLSKDSTSEGFSDIVKPIFQSLPIYNPIIEKTESLIIKTEIDSEDKTSEANSTHFKNQNESDKNRESIEYKSNEEATIINSERISNITKASTMNTMWKLIKVVTDSIYKSTRKSFNSKMNYLEGLRSNILSSIEDQVERTWPDENARWSRRVRDVVGRGHVEFPSSESALMSISFLTFAVFLIKLVLQVIHTYKNKTMLVSPAVVTAVGRAAAAAVDAIKSNQQ